jgi:arylformamidase
MERKGPLGQAKPVFLDYSQEQLDQAYDQAKWAPEMAQLEAADGTRSARVREEMPPITRRYGPGEADLIDIFTPANARNVPILLFIHGGAWTRNSRLDASLAAPTLVGRHAAYATPDFGSLKTSRLPDMIENCRRCLEWLVRNAADFGGNPDRLYLAGHSSGAHLAGCLLVTDWTKRGLPADAIKGALLVSGMYDLHPVLLSSRSTYLHVTPEEAAEASPMRHLAGITCPVAVFGVRRRARRHGTARRSHHCLQHQSFRGRRAAGRRRQRDQPNAVRAHGNLARAQVGRSDEAATVRCFAGLPVVPVFAQPDKCVSPLMKPPGRALPRGRRPISCAGLPRRQPTGTQTGSASIRRHSPSIIDFRSSASCQRSDSSAPSGPVMA